MAVSTTVRGGLSAVNFGRPGVKPNQLMSDAFELSCINRVLAIKRLSRVPISLAGVLFADSLDRVAIDQP